MPFSVKSLAVTTALLVSALTSTAVLAHAHLTSAEPAPQSQLTVAPTQLTLHFSEDLEPSFSNATVTHQGDKTVSTGKASLSDQEKNTLVVPLNAPLSAGEYQVAWHALSVDGHKTTGTYIFTVK